MGDVALDRLNAAAARPRAHDRHVRGLEPRAEGEQQDVAAAHGGDRDPPQPAPLAGNIFKVLVQPGQLVQEGDLVVILEAMKMETEIRAFKAGTVSTVEVKVGDAVAVGHPLLSIA